MFPFRASAAPATKKFYDRIKIKVYDPVVKMSSGCWKNTQIQLGRSCGFAGGLAYVLLVIKGNGQQISS